MHDYDAGTLAWASGVAGAWAGVLVHLLLYMLLLPQGQCRVSVLIGFREESSGVQAADGGEIFH